VTPGIGVRPTCPPFSQDSIALSGDAPATYAVLLWDVRPWLDYTRM
jgi:hypothetical protein